MVFIRSDVFDPSFVINILKVTNNRKFDLILSDLDFISDYKDKRSNHVENVINNINLLEINIKLLKLNGNLVLKSQSGYADNYLID